MKPLLKVFAIAFVLNLIWENLHVFLYSNYKGGEITEFILIRASLFDALLITIILLPFLYTSIFKHKGFMIFIIGVFIAIINEWYGLSTGRWAYNDFMPIIPILEIGLTPTFQLGILGYLSFKIQEKFNR